MVKNVKKVSNPIFFFSFFFLTTDVVCKATMPTKKIKYFFINYPFNKKYLSLTGPLENNHIRMYTNMKYYMCKNL